MTQLDEFVQESPDQQLEGLESFDASSTPANDGEQPPVTEAEEQLRRLQARLTRQGRRLAEADESARRNESIAAQQRQQIQSLETRLNQLGQTFSRKEAQQLEAYIESLPPDQQALERIKRMEARIAGTGQPTRSAAPPTLSRSGPSREERVAYMKAESERILDVIADETGVELTGEEDGIDWTDQRSFTASARAVAVVLGRSSGTAPKREDTMPRASTKTPTAPKGADSSVSDTERIRRAVREELGIAQPNSARAIDPQRAGSLRSEDIQATAANYNSRLGPKANRKALEEQLARAKKQAGVA